MTPTVTAFAVSPDRGQGLARDMRVRWALEEVGQPYEVRLLSFAEMKEPAHLALHPFGQIPTYQEGDLVLFETGSIVLHIADHHVGLLADNATARARAITWMFAAVNTVEPPIASRPRPAGPAFRLLDQRQTLHGPGSVALEQPGGRKLPGTVLYSRPRPQAVSHVRPLRLLPRSDLVGSAAFRSWSPHSQHRLHLLGQPSPTRSWREIARVASFDIQRVGERGMVDQILITARHGDLLVENLV